MIGRYHKHDLPNREVFDEQRYFTPDNRPLVFEVDGIRFGLNICEDTWNRYAPEAAAAAGAEVLLVPHHGSRTSSTPDFLAAVQPQVAVVQVAARNAYGHPHPQVMARYQTMGIPTVTSPDCGAWWWSSEGQSADQTAPQRCWRHRSPRYWQASRPDVHHLGP